MRWGCHELSPYSAFTNAFRVTNSGERGSPNELVDQDLVSPFAPTAPAGAEDYSPGCVPGGCRPYPIQALQERQALPPDLAYPYVRQKSGYNRSHVR